MITTIEHRQQQYVFDSKKPIDISITIKPGKNNVNAFHAPNPHAEPVVAGNFVGSTEQGGVVNFFNLTINPHGNGTHTECVGHISKEKYFVGDCFTSHLFLCEVITIIPMKNNDSDEVIYQEQIKKHLKHAHIDAVAIRTLPNDKLKTVAKYSGHNPCYLHHEAAQYLAEIGIQHLLIDLPSVDREEDDGKLLAHKAFWQFPEKPRLNATITELIYIPNEVPDGLYVLCLQPCNIELDAVPSKPVLYRVV